jgi:hypothetical protein
VEFVLRLNQEETAMPRDRRQPASRGKALRPLRPWLAIVRWASFAGLASLAAVPAWAAGHGLPGAALAAQAGPAAAGAPLFSRPYGSIQALFAKGTVNGSELVTELIAVRTLMRNQRSAAAVGALLGAAEPANTGGFDLKGEALKVAAKVAEESIKPYVSSIGFGALDLHMARMIEDPQLLASENITLPSSKDMTQAQAQRVINMAAILVATRVTGKILRKAQEDFANVEADYTQLIERREGAAKVLYDLLLRGAGNSPELNGVYADDDLKYLRDNVGRMSIKDFANDLGAQNLALRYLRKTDPTAWGEYKTRSDGLMSSTRGYIRTTAGVTAFAALLANFGNETLGAVRNKKGADILTAVPFAWEFVKEVPPLLKVCWQVGAAGVIELPMKANKRFRVVEGAASEDLAKAADVFAAMKKRNAEPVFNEALFRNGSDGLLYKLFRCDKSEVGRMLDTAVPVAEREKFAAAYVPSDTARFSFANAFSAPASNAREAELGDELLRKDHRERTDVSVALGEVQRSATRGSTRWNNDQLLRLILANREGTAAHATLQLGDMLVRPVPSMQSVYAYESLVDGCSQQFGGGPAAAPAATPPVAAAPEGKTKPTPATKPGAKPRPAN